MNPIKDKHGVEIKEGDTVRYYDSTTMWLQGKVIDIGSSLAIETEENPIPLHTWTGQYVYDGHPIKELEIVSRNIRVREDGTLTKVYKDEDAKLGQPNPSVGPAGRFDGGDFPTVVPEWIHPSPTNVTEIVIGQTYAFIGGEPFPPESLLFLDNPPVAVLPPTHWKCLNHLEPYLNPESTEKCEVCGAAR